MIYVQILRATVADRHEALNGQHNDLVDFETKVTLNLAGKGEGLAPAKTLELFGTRENVRPLKELGSLRGITINLRQSIGQSLGDTVTAKNAVVERQLLALQAEAAAHRKVTLALDKEVESFTNILNARLDYYRQLQQISDMVAASTAPTDEFTLARMLQDEEKLASKIASSKGRLRYMEHLKQSEGSDAQQYQTCIICREIFQTGVLTVCGHQFCLECITQWWTSHRNCPVCKRMLHSADLHDVTYKLQNLTVYQEGARGRPGASTNSAPSAIFTEFSESKLAAIKSVKLDGPSFTTKVDMLARHLIWLRTSDPGAKSIICMSRLAALPCHSI